MYCIRIHVWIPLKDRSRQLQPRLPWKWCFFYNKLCIKSIKSVHCLIFPRIHSMPCPPRFASNQRGRLPGRPKLDLSIRSPPTGPLCGHRSLGKHGRSKVSQLACSTSYILCQSHIVPWQKQMIEDIADMLPLFFIYVYITN